ncbi:MAG: UDP-N-acetylenolpyruvoylglucosamine reductase [Gammaproteobacteria bacterium]|nr:MAG: UDP-N-acetylenolpyruvoylglucosamine reductase [Gammaproteobacteria bacterium]
MIELRTNASLRACNTLAVDARCRCLIAFASVEEFREGIKLATLDNAPFLILGEGSNVVFVSDFDGYVLCNQIKGIQEKVLSPDQSLFAVGAGENWHQFVRRTNEAGFNGLENLALIPGTVGATPVQNVGAYGEEVANHIVKVEALECRTGNLKSFANSDCEFGYRDSFFKRHPGKYGITRVVFKLTKTRNLNTEYGELASRQAQVPFRTSLELNEYVCQVRSQKLPDPALLPNAGSFFKNPIVSDQDYTRLKQAVPQVVAYQVINGWKLAAGWLIQEAGLKGYRDEHVGVYDKQALVLVNHNNGAGRDVITLARHIQSIVYQKFSVKLEIEPLIIGRDATTSFQPVLSQ